MDKNEVAQTAYILLRERSKKADSVLKEEIENYTDYLNDSNWLKSANFDILSNGYYIGGKNSSNQRFGIGLYLFNTHDLYLGEWRNNAKNGTGIFLQASGGLYFGEWLNGKQEGHGHIHYADGYESEGQYRSGYEIKNMYVQQPSGNRYTKTEKSGGAGCLGLIIISIVLYWIFG